MQRALHVAFAAVVCQHLHQCSIAMNGGQVHEAAQKYDDFSFVDTLRKK
jgi:hypothetical protein